MIKVSNLNKYFNKGRSNEIHVINNVSLELPDNGFITILGKSGSGKTTLLNVIGGLDDFHDGTITYEDLKFDKYKMNDIDKYRSKNIGYIFQNYLVMSDETVFENVDTSLKLAGIQDKAERKKRTNEALKAVGMTKYRRKAANSLSGGQKQRIGIARAIAKLPKIIIADEPTGNLDSENSVEIMRILRDISKKYLVIMVTHNENLAVAFADRIIRYKDGSIISDETNVPTHSLKDLKGKHDSLYLSDFKHTTNEAGGIKTDVYSTDGKNLELDIKIIEKDGRKYLFVDDSVIVNDKSINILETRPIKKKEDKNEKISTFDHSSFDDVQRKHVPFHILLRQAFFAFFHEAKFKTTAYKILFGLMGVGISVVSFFTYYTFFSAEYIKALQTMELSSLSIASIEISAGRYESLRQKDVLRAVENYEESKFRGLVTSINVNSYSLGLGKITGVSADYACAYIHVPSVNDENPNPRYGKKATEADEIMISTGLITSAIPQYAARGYKYEYLLGKEFYRSNGHRVTANAVDVTPTITGIVENRVPTIYLTRAGEYSVYQGLLSTTDTTFSLLNDMDFDLKENVETGTITPVNERVEPDEEHPVDTPINVLISSAATRYFNEDLAEDFDLFNVVGTFENSRPLVLLDNESDVNIYKTRGGKEAFSLFALSSDIPTGSDFVLVDGRYPKGYGEYLVSENNQTTSKNIVGHYKANNLNLGTIYTTFHTIYSTETFKSIRNLAQDYLGQITTNYSTAYKSAIYSDNYKTTMNFINADLPPTTQYAYKSTRAAINEANQASLTNSSNIIMVSVCGLLLVLMLILVLISTRSNMIRHIYSISVFRSLGTKKSDVYRIFISKDLINYLFTIFIGVLVAFVAEWIFAGSFGLFAVPFWLFLIVLVLTYGISLLGTMIPLWGLLAKTPNQIASKYDI